MASTLFTYSPTTGSGNTNVSVGPNSNNTGTTDRVSTITFSGNGGSKSVTVTQYHKPFFTVFSSTNVPASGKTIYFSVTTEYDFFFGDIPSWITVKKGQTTYSNNERISKGAATGAMFALDVAENTGLTRSVSNTFKMGWYIGLTEQSDYQYFSINQAAASAATTEEYATVEFYNITQGNQITVVVSATSQVTETDRITYLADGTDDESTAWAWDCKALPGENITFSLYVDSCQSGPLTVHIDYDNYAEGTVNVLYEGDTLSLTTPYVPGAEVVFKVEE